MVMSYPSHVHQPLSHKDLKAFDVLRLCNYQCQAQRCSKTPGSLKKTHNCVLRHKQSKKLKNGYF